MQVEKLIREDDSLPLVTFNPVKGDDKEKSFYKLP